MVMKNNSKIVFGLFVVVAFSLFSVSLVSAAVGVGLSPSRVNLQVVGGEMLELDLLVFNTGDSTMDLGIVVEGAIKDFTVVDLSSLSIDPEPKPHELPIKNGRTFNVKFNPPVSRKIVTYTGTIVAVSGTSGESQFGGSVGVATQVILTVVPPKSFFDYIELIHLIIAGFIIAIIVVIVLLKKSGFTIKFEKKGVKRKK